MQKTQETWFPSLGWEDALEEEMATHSSILAGKIPWTEEPGGLLACYSPWGRKELGTTERLSVSTHTHTHTHPWLGQEKLVGRGDNNKEATCES